MSEIKDFKLLIVDRKEERREEWKRLLNFLELPSLSFLSAPGRQSSTLDIPYNAILIVDPEEEKILDDWWNLLKAAPTQQKAHLCITSSLKNSAQMAQLRRLMAQGAFAILPAPLNPFRWLLTLKTSARIETSRVESLLGQSFLLKDLTAQERKELAQVAPAHLYLAQGLITHQQCPCDRFFIVLKGTVTAYLGKQLHLSVDAPAGSAFGELNMIAKESKPLRAIAKEASIVLEIGPAILTDKSYPIRQKILDKISQSCSARLQGTCELLAQTGLSHLINQLYIYSPDQDLNHSPLPELPTLEAPENPLPPPAISEINLKEMEPTPEIKKEETETKPIPAVAEEYDESVPSTQQYETLIKKINLHTDFLHQKIPAPISEMIRHRLHSYWVGSKLARHNPHQLLPAELFTAGSPRFKTSLHLIVVAEQGFAAYEECYNHIPFSHHIIGSSLSDCRGTFLGSAEAIERFLSGNCLKKALWFDLEMPIGRLKNKNPVFEILSHTIQDVRDETIFLIFDDVSGKMTRLLRYRFPNHQFLSVVKGISVQSDDIQEIFALTEQKMKEQGYLHVQKNPPHGFYVGDSFFIPDLSPFYRQLDKKIADHGYLFGMIGLVAQLGPEISGINWGSKGGATGALKAARALFGIRGAQTNADLAAAIEWAEGKNDKPNKT